MGRAATVTNPYFSTSDLTYGVTQNQYDALGRATQITKQDGSVSTVSYAGNRTTTRDEAGKQRRACSDALGRLSSVWEDPGGLNYETDYQYDALGNLLRVDQKGSAPTDSTQWRTRLFTYDSLSRLLTARNPESGLITYQYDNNGNQTLKTAKVGGAITTYEYDAENKLARFVTPSNTAKSARMKGSPSSFALRSRLGRRCSFPCSSLWFRFCLYSCWKRKKAVCSDRWHGPRRWWLALPLSWR